MDPSKVKLTLGQKVIPLLKAIDKEIPWQMIVLFGVGIFVAILTGTSLPILITGSHYGNMILTVLISFVAGVAAFFITGLTVFTVLDKIMPLIKRISNHYEEEALKVKKEVLENAEVEMLKK